MGGSRAVRSCGPRRNENHGESSSQSGVRIPTADCGKGSSTMVVSRGLADPKVSLNRRHRMGNGLIFPCQPTPRDASGSSVYGRRRIQAY